MKESIVYLLILVFTETGAEKPTLKIMVKPDQVSCEQSRAAIQQGSVHPLQVCQCVPFDLDRASQVARDKSDRR